MTHGTSEYLLEQRLRDVPLCWGDWIFLRKSKGYRGWEKEKTSGNQKSHRETKDCPSPRLQDECQRVDLSLFCRCSFCFSFLFFSSSPPPSFSLCFSFSFSFFLPPFLFSFLSSHFSFFLSLATPPSFFRFSLAFLFKKFPWIALSPRDKGGLLRSGTRGTSLKKKEGGGQEIFLLVSFYWHHHGFGVQVHKPGKTQIHFPFCKQLHSEFAFH